MSCLKLVADRVVAEKYEIENFAFDFFERKKNVSFVKPNYTEALKNHLRIDMRYDAFDWQIGVGLFGLLKANEFLKDDRYMEFIKDWADFHFKRGLPPMTVNSSTPYYAILELYKRYGDLKYYNACKEAAEFVISEGKRTNEGAFEHTVLEAENPSQIWADTMFMAGVFLAEWGRFTNDIIYLNEAARQILLHYKYLTDEETGLLFHAYSCSERNHLSGVRWGRANGWGIVSCVEILERLPDKHKLRNEIITKLQKHIDSLGKYMCDDGSWHTVVDSPDTYKETTVGCCVLYAVKKALKLGYIRGDYERLMENSAEYIISHIKPDGEVTDTSAGTPVMASKEEYDKIPCEMSYYGQGLALMALSKI